MDDVVFPLKYKYVYSTDDVFEFELTSVVLTDNIDQLKKGEKFDSAFIDFVNGSLRFERYNKLTENYETYFYKFNTNINGLRLMEYVEE